MSALFILIPIALVTLAGAIWAFIWAVNHEQFEELEQEGARILMDDPPGADRKREPRS